MLICTIYEVLALLTKHILPFFTQRTAEKLSMTNGDYVFFMVTLSRQGFNPERRDDTWWKVTDENADLVRKVAV